MNNEIKTSNFVPSKPDYKADGIAVWKGVDKFGNDFVKVKIMGNKAIPCFAPKIKETNDAKADLAEQVISDLALPLEEIKI